MTRKHDRYFSRFDDNGVRGPIVASVDLNDVLLLLKRFMKERGLLDETTKNYLGTWTIDELFDIAQQALYESIDPALSVYQRLRQNAEAASIVAEATDDQSWLTAEYMLSRTLNNHPIIGKGWVNAAKRDLAKRKKQQAKQQAGGDAA